MEKNLCYVLFEYYKSLYILLENPSGLNKTF